MVSSPLRPGCTAPPAHAPQVPADLQTWGKTLIYLLKSDPSPTLRTRTSSCESEPGGEVVLPLRVFMSWIWAAEIQGVLSPFFSACGSKLTLHSGVGRPLPHPMMHSSQHRLLGFQRSSWCSWTFVTWNKLVFYRETITSDPKGSRLKGRKS